MMLMMEKGSDCKKIWNKNRDFWDVVPENYKDGGERFVLNRNGFAPPMQFVISVVPIVSDQRHQRLDWR